MAMNPNGDQHLCDECDINGLETLAVAVVRHLDDNYDVEYVAELCGKCLTIPTDYVTEIVSI